MPAGRALGVSMEGHPGIFGVRVLRKLCRELRPTNNDRKRTYHRFYWTCDPSQPQAPFMPTAGRPGVAPATQANAQNT